VITGAAICPAAPLLARELTGRDPVIPELREACAAAVARLVRSGPEVIAVVGPARRTATWPADGRLRLASFAPAVGGPEPAQALPLPLGLGARLLGALRAMDESLARELLASGRAAWQVLAGALPGHGTAAEVFYFDAPFGVFYLIAWLARSARGPG
jgi:hypothetical protein